MERYYHYVICSVHFTVSAVNNNSTIIRAILTRRIIYGFALTWTLHYCQQHCFAGCNKAGECPSFAFQGAHDDYLFPSERRSIRTDAGVSSPKIVYIGAPLSKYC